MRPFLMLLAVFGVGVPSSAAPEGTASRPRWVARYLDSPPVPWDGWRNSLAPKGRPAPPLALATEGTTDYVVVVPEKASVAETRAAGELRLWLGKITGAEFPIVPDTMPAQARELSVGRTARATQAAREQETAGGVEGYAIVVEGERVFLLGAGPIGPLPAVFALLEEDLGVRWYSAPGMAGDDWDARIKDMNDALSATPWAPGLPENCRVPRRPTLRAGIVPRSSKPGFPVRHLDFTLTSMPWGLRNRINGGWATQYSQHWYMHGGGAGHTFHWLVPPGTYFQEHPEYFSLVGGKRQWKDAQLCLSNPAVAEIAAETAAASLRDVAQDIHYANIKIGNFTGPPLAR